MSHWQTAGRSDDGASRSERPPKKEAPTRSRRRHPVSQPAGLSAARLPGRDGLDRLVPRAPARQLRPRPAA